ncbi:hypothetical protein BJF84_15730 [Rhodococcus sp. CUA-806]|jgi:hypothetical protein|nr:hypothetical protein BJF84_15730 [Rhodococcus sp. CUA-806]
MQREDCAVTAITTTRAALAALLREQSDLICDEVTAALYEPGDPRSASLGREWLRTSVQANLQVLHHLVQYPHDISLAEPPVSALALVHRLARERVPFHEIVRSYYLASTRWIQWIVQALAELTPDARDLADESTSLIDLAHSYFDHVIERAAVEYESEAGRWSHQQEAIRLAQVTEILDATPVHSRTVGVPLCYGLGQTHIAVVLWVDGVFSDSELSAGRGVINALTDVYGCRGQPLVVIRDAATLWAWLPLPPRGTSVSENDVLVESLCSRSEIRAALGEPAYGVEGFRTSHRQALGAYQVATAHPHGPSLTRYREVASLTLLSGDLDQARVWVREVLGGLAFDGARETDLRNTLLVYSRSNGSATAAARLLNCHKNTVLYRLKTIESLIGYSISDNRVGLDVALLACQWFGKSVLGQSR